MNISFLIPKDSIQASKNWHQSCFMLFFVYIFKHCKWDSPKELGSINVVKNYHIENQ